MVTRRGSVKRGSLSWEDEEALEAKRLKAALEAMGMMKKRQKEFTWDVAKPQKAEEEEESKTRKSSLSQKKDGQMSKETAMKILGLAHTAGKVTKPRSITDYTEDEILVAFQAECKSLSRIMISHLKLHFYFQLTRESLQSCRIVTKRTKFF